MKGCVCFLVVLSLLVASIASADPSLKINPQALRQATTQSQADQRKADQDEARMLQWMGVGFMLAGGLFEALSYTALANDNVFCIGGSFYASCTNIKTTNWGVMGAGLGMTATGIGFWYAGSQKRKHAPSIAIGRSRFQVSKQFAF